MSFLLQNIESERLLFRKLLPSDFNTWLPFHQDKRSSEFWTGLPIDPNTACEEDFERTFYRYRNNLGGKNALIHKESGVLLGLCGLLVQAVDDTKELEIGYSILPKYWNKGYATEAAIQCKQYAFEHKLASSLISIIHTKNKGSQKVAINNGMHLDKTTIYKDNPVHIFRVSSSY